MLFALSIALVFLLGISWIVWDYSRTKKVHKELAHVARQPLNAREVRWVEKYCRIWHKLNPAEKEHMRGYIRQFCHTMYFEPCGELTKVTEEMKIAIAVNAVLPLLGNRQPFFPNLHEILVYPNDFFPEKEFPEEKEEAAIGEATSNGNIILSWPEVADCGEEPFQGSNVVIHECAHMLDDMRRTAIGKSDLAYLHFNISEHFGLISEQFVKHWLKFRETGQGVLDEYAGESPAEFFAVATEFYFELPHEFARDYPDMYRMMSDIYGKLSYQ